MSRDNKGPSPNGPLMPRPSPLRKLVGGIPYGDG